MCQNLTSYDIVYDKHKITEEFDESTPVSEALTALGIGEVTELKVKLVERPYTLSLVYEHILKFREVAGLHFLDKQLEAPNSGVSKFSSIQLNEVRAADEKDEKVELSADEKKTLGEVAASILEEGSDLAAHGSFTSPAAKIRVPIKSLAISQWSVTPSQRTKGDLLYLVLQTLEGEIFHVTCHYSGFFVNRSSNATFNPLLKVNEKGKFSKHFILYELVKSLSSLFTKTIAENTTQLSGSAPFPEEYLLPTTGSLASPWLSTEEKVQPDLSRPQLPVLANGVDGSDYVKDWNEDFQTIKELPKDTLNLRILREKLINKSLHEFNKAATNTAINIIKGNLTPLNPYEPKEKHIFLKNGIFYSFGINATGAFDTTGGDEAARYAASKDLAGVRVLNQIDADGIHNLVTCIVDFVGERVICQAPVPGIFNNPAEEDAADKVSYGLSTDHDKIFADEKFIEVLKPVAEALHLKTHKVETDTGVKSEGDLVTSKDTKGIYGTDDRKYVIDLYRTTPLDIEFIEENFTSEGSYPHGEAVVRHEAVEEWYKRKVAALFKAETERLEKEGKTIEGTDGEKPQIAIPHDQIVLNPDAFTGVNESEEDQHDVREISKFIKDKLIEEYLESIGSQVVPFDGSHLTEHLHRLGINMRYLGHIAREVLVKRDEHLQKEQEIGEKNLAEVKRREEEQMEKATKDTEEKETEEKKEQEKEEGSQIRLSPVVAHCNALHGVAVQEMVARAAKHVLRKLGKDVPFYLKPHFVVHFHNCLLSQVFKPVEIDDVLKSFYSEKELSFIELTRSQVSDLIAKEVSIRFRYELEQDWVSTIKPLQLLREIAIKFGIQWKAQAYAFTEEDLAKLNQPAPQAKKNRKRSKEEVPAPIRETTFIVDDLLSFVPIVKDSSYKATLVQEIFETAKVQLYNGEKDLGVTLLNELASIYEQIYGRVHAETSQFNNILALSYAELGHKSEACTVARKSCLLNERTSGFDSFETITGYINAAYLEAANNDFINAFELYKKAIADWTLVFGSSHPSSINTFSNLAEMLVEHKLFIQAKQFYHRAIDVSDNLNGADSSISAMLRYKLATVLLQNAEYETAASEFAKALDTFNRVVGPDDRLTKEAVNFVTNIKTYLAYNKQQAAEKKKAQANGKSLVQPPKSKKGKKTVADPNIASQSIEDILLYIEGPLSKKKNKKKNL